MNEIDKLRMILRDSMERASRHKRATSDRKYLMFDLEYIELQMQEGLERLARIERGETKNV